jgi:hypothetical protein
MQKYAVKECVNPKECRPPSAQFYLFGRAVSCLQTSFMYVSRHGSYFPLLREGVLWFLGLVVAGWVED